jgi:glycogen debranching enzyme
MNNNMKQDRFAEQATKALGADQTGDATPLFHLLAHRYRDDRAAAQFCREVLDHGVAAYAAILTYKQMLISDTYAVRLVDGNYVLAPEGSE